MTPRTAVLVVTLLLARLATADAQTAPAAPGAPTPAPGVAATPTAPGASAPAAIPGALVPPQPPTAPAPGNPSNPGDFSRNPHPEMPWFGPATPDGQFLRWVWVPPRAVAVGDARAGPDGHAESARLAVEGRLEHLADTVHVERLQDVVERPSGQRLAGEAFIGVCRDDDDWDVGTKDAELVERLRPRGIGKVDVEEDGIGALGRRQGVRVGGGSRETGVVVEPLQHVGEDLAQRGFILHDQDDGTHLGPNDSMRDGENRSILSTYRGDRSGAVH